MLHPPLCWSVEYWWTKINALSLQRCKCISKNMSFLQSPSSVLYQLMFCCHQFCRKCLFTQGTHTHGYTLMDTQNTVSLSRTHTWTHTQRTCMCAQTHVHNLRRHNWHEHYITKLVFRVSRNTPFAQSTMAAGVLVVIDTIITHTSWSNNQTVTKDGRGSVTCRKIKRTRLWSNFF